MEDFKDLLVTNEEKNDIKQNSPQSLPLNPTAQGYSGQEVRRKLSASIVGDKGSLLALVERKMERLVEIFEILDPKPADIFNLEVDFYSPIVEEGLVIIDGVQTKLGDLILVNDSESYGLYFIISEEGEWEKSFDILPNQIFSVLNGEEFGGSLLKLNEDFSIIKVKSSERVYVSKDEPTLNRNYKDQLWFQILEDD